MACPLGVHCVTGRNAWWFAEEEPPLSMTWFAASFATALYSRAPTATIAFSLITLMLFETIHVTHAWLRTDLDGGPLPLTPGGPLLMLFGAHPVPETLLVTYPWFVVIGSALGYAAAVGYNTPTLFQKWTQASRRFQEMGPAEWYQLQLRYTVQLLLLAYMPNLVAFGSIAFIVGSQQRVALLFIWIFIYVGLITIFWWWNHLGLSHVWKAANGETAHARHTRFYCLWAAAMIIVWLPVVALSGTNIPSQARVLIGIVLLTIALAPTFPSLTPGWWGGEEEVN